MTLTTLSVESKDVQAFVKLKLKKAAIDGKELTHAQYFHTLVEKEEANAEASK